MTLIKNEIPILEYDSDPQAVLMPGNERTYHFPERAVMLFMETEIEDYAAAHDCPVVGQFDSITKQFPVYQTTYQGQELVFCQAPLGGAFSVTIMEQLIAGGVRGIIATGCCGALGADTEGDFIIPVRALRQEGTSYQYLPPAREIALCDKGVAAVEAVLRKAGFSYRKCKTWTTDGFFRETKAMVQYRKDEGCEVVDMECASLAACAQMRGVTFGQLLFTADTLADSEAYDSRNWARDTFSTALQLAFDAAVILDIEKEGENNG